MEVEEQVPAPAPAPAPVPAPAPAPEPSALPDEEIPSEPEMGMDDEMNMEPEGEDDNEVVTFKTIQKLTGKLAQKLRTLGENPEEPMSSKDIKYVVNSILSALNLDNLDEEDKEAIMSKFEGGEDMGMDDMGSEDMGMDDMGSEDEEQVPQPEPEGEMMESMDTEDFEVKPSRPKPRRLSGFGIKDEEAIKVEEMIEGLFSESKVDKILKGYFKTSDSEKRLMEHKKQTIQRIQKLSEGIEQEVVSRKVLNKYNNAELIGKTKGKNLVFQINESKIRVTPKGEIL